MRETGQPRKPEHSSSAWIARWALLAASIFGAGCNAAAPDTVTTAKSAPASEARHDDAAGEEATAPSCAPAVLGLRASTIASIEVACPGGFAERQSFAALPVAGRFGTLEELTAAFCVASVAMKGVSSVPMGIDFGTSDVVSYVFDANAGPAPALYDGAGDLWVRTTTRSCDDRASELRSIAFVVPKRVRVNEQACSAACATP